MRDCDEVSGTGVKFWWLEQGSIRYNHDCWLSCRGAVNDVPDNFSAYRPCGAFCGEFCPTGNVPGMASLLQISHQYCILNRLSSTYSLYAPNPF
jgi:hypothetical protein